MARKLPSVVKSLLLLLGVGVEVGLNQSMMVETTSEVWVGYC
jgi:hypothetical protein